MVALRVAIDNIGFGLAILQVKGYMEPSLCDISWPRSLGGIESNFKYSFYEAKIVGRH